MNRYLGPDSIKSEDCSEMASGLAELYNAFELSVHLSNEPVSVFNAFPQYFWTVNVQLSPVVAYKINNLLSSHNRHFDSLILNGLLLHFCCRPRT